MRKCLKDKHNLYINVVYQAYVWPVVIYTEVNIQAYDKNICIGL